jgi:hypothetical protein
MEGILLSENESADSHCEEDKYSVGIEGVYAFRHLFPHETSCLTQCMLGFRGNSALYSFHHRTPCVVCVDNCDNILRILIHLEYFYGL